MRSYELAPSPNTLQLEYNTIVDFAALFLIRRCDLQLDATVCDDSPRFLTGAEGRAPLAPRAQICGALAPTGAADQQLQQLQQQQRLVSMHRS